MLKNSVIGQSGPEPTKQVLEREAFLAMAAHDLRAPLRNIRMTVVDLAPHVAPEGLPLLELVERTARAGQTTVNDILSGAEAPAPGGSDVSQVNLADLVAEIRCEVDRFSRHDIRGEQCRLVTDCQVLRLVLGNLIENAVRHSGHASAEVRVWASPMAGQRGWIDVRVADNGPGLCDTGREVLAGGVTRPGVAYGLRGVRRLVELRRGEVVCHDRGAGQGAEIGVVLPGRVLPARARLRRPLRAVS